MRRCLTILFISIILAACSGPKDTLLPHDPKKRESIKPAMAKLTPEEQELVNGYITRHTSGKKGPGIPEGMTIGKAIEEQRKFMADAEKEGAERQALKAKLHAEREAAMKSLREAVTLALVSKKIMPEEGSSYRGIVQDEKFVVAFSCRNNTDKDISGVQGYVSIKDLSGVEISGFHLSQEKTIKAGKTETWTVSRPVKYSSGTNNDRKLAGLAVDKYRMVWEPRLIVFKNGTKLTAPK